MSELGDLVAVYGRIDEAVVQDRALLPKVAAMVPPYHQGVAGWYQVLADWRRQDPEHVPVSELPGDLHAALSSLGGSVDEPDESQGPAHEAWATRHWLNARRLLATATLGRIQGYVADAPSDAELCNLHAHMTPDVDHAHKLLRHLRRADAYPDIRSWPRMMADAHSQGLITDKYLPSTVVAPIVSDADAFRVVHSRILGPSVAFRTYHHIRNLDVASAANALDASLWERYNPPWCAMTPLPAPAGIRRFVEEVAADCTTGPRLITVLDFKHSGPLSSGGGILEFRIPDGPLLRESSGLVTIDEGSLEIRPDHSGDGTLHFITTKRVQFSSMKQMPSMMVAAFGFLVWILGWDSLSERFLYFFARQGDPGAPVDVVPAQEPSAYALPPMPSLLSASRSGDAGTLFNIGFSWWQTYLRNCIDSARSWVDRAASGRYGLGDYVADMTAASEMIASNTVAIAGLGAQMWREMSDSGGGGTGGPGGATDLSQPQPGTPISPSNGRRSKRAPAKSARAGGAKKATTRRASLAKRGAVGKKAAKKSPGRATRKAAKRVASAASRRATKKVAKSTPTKAKRGATRKAAKRSSAPRPPARRRAR